MLKNPVELLVAFENIITESRSRQILQSQTKAHQVCLGIYVGQTRLALSMDDAFEILAYSHLTAIPSVQTWFKGLVNIRGELITVSDLQEFLFTTATNPNSKNRIIVINHQNELMGILVSEIIGIKRLYGTDDNETFDVPMDLKPIISSILKDDFALWPLLDIKKLLNSKELLQVNLHQPNYFKGLWNESHTNG